MMRFAARDGSIRWVETRSIRLAFSDSPAVIVLVRDLTARRTAEEALRRSEDRFVKFFHVNPACSTVTRLSDNIFVDVNERFCQLTGFSREELLGRTGVSVGLWYDPTERARIERKIRAGGRVHDAEVRLRKKSGQFIDVRMSLETFALGGVDCVFALSYDVTERKMLEAQLRQAQKMDAVGRLAGGIAHDFNNLLTAIRGYSEMLTTTLPQGTRPHDAAAHIHRSSLRASSLTEQLLVFTRRRPQESRVVQLNDVVQSMATMLRRLLGEDLELVLELAPAIGRVRMDPTQLEQVLLNLAVNARDAMPRGGRLTISTADGLDRDGRSRVILTARDTGGGIDDATLAAHLRALLHDQGDRQGHRPRPVDRVRRGHAGRRRHHRRQRARARRRLPHLAAAHRRAGAAADPDDADAAQRAGRRRDHPARRGRRGRARLRALRLAPGRLPGARRLRRRRRAAHAPELRRRDPPRAQRHRDAGDERAGDGSARDVAAADDEGAAHVRLSGRQRHAPRRDRGGSGVSCRSRSRRRR